MEDLKELRDRVADLTTHLIREGILDDQYRQLQRLENMPAFSYDMMSFYLTRTEELIDNLHGALSLKRKDMDSSAGGKHTKDLNKVEELGVQLKGSSTSVGAKQLTDTGHAIIQCCKEKDHKGCVECLKRLKQEYSLLKTKVEPLLSLEQEIVVLVESTKALEDNPNLEKAVDSEKN